VEKTGPEEKDEKEETAVEELQRHRTLPTVPRKTAVPVTAEKKSEKVKKRLKRPIVSPDQLRTPAAAGSSRRLLPVSVSPPFKFLTPPKGYSNSKGFSPADRSPQSDGAAADGVCRNKWDPNLHPYGACGRCLHHASESHKQIFAETGRCPHVTMTRGGCVAACPYFKNFRGAGVVGDSVVVRLCSRCFNDTHMLKLTPT